MRHIIGKKSIVAFKYVFKTMTNRMTYQLSYIPDANLNQKFTCLISNSRRNNYIFSIVYEMIDGWTKGRTEGQAIVNCRVATKCKVATNQQTRLINWQC